jgi:hypothetical protein
MFEMNGFQKSGLTFRMLQKKLVAKNAGKKAATTADDEPAFNKFCGLCITSDDDFVFDEDIVEYAYDWDNDPDNFLPSDKVDDPHPSFLSSRRAALEDPYHRSRRHCRSFRNRLAA